MRQLMYEIVDGGARMTRIYRVALAVLLTAGLAAPAWAQAVTQADIQRLQDNAYLAERDISSLQSRDAGRASTLQAELNDLKDEVIYLKVKLRKERTLTRTEFGDVRDRIESLRSRASTSNASNDRGNRFPPASADSGSRAQGTNRGGLGRGVVEIPSGTELDVRLQTALNSGTAQVEDRFEATTMTDLNLDGRVTVPAGTLLRGVVTGVEPATRTNRTSKMTVSFDQMTLNGRDYPIRGTVTQAIEGEGIKGDLPKAGAGAAVGGILGAVLGGGKGAILGAIIGGGGTIAATEGKEVELPQGTVLRVRIDSPVQVQTNR
jgi:TolA-binding protein